MPPWEGCLHVKAGTLLLQKERYQSTCNRSGRLLAAAARSGLSARLLASVSSVEDAAAESEGPKGVWEKEEGGLGVKSFVWREANLPGKFPKTAWHHGVSIQGG